MTRIGRRPESNPDSGTLPHRIAPSRGWNSWLSYGFSLTEEELLQQAFAMSNMLGDAAFDTLVIDAQWYVDNPRRPRVGDPDPSVRPNLDQFGRPRPSSRRFPSANEFGFRNLARLLHSQGQKLGIHLMRGVPRAAALRRAPVQGTEFTCMDIADPSSVCAWNLEMFGLIPGHPGSQAYYDSLLSQLAEWEIDYVKYDDLGNPYSRWDIESIRKSIERCGRPIVFSVSPGPMDVSNAAHAAKYADSYRVSGDLWDDWGLVLRSARAGLNLTEMIEVGGFTDLDMLPIGKIGMRAEVGEVRPSRLTPHEVASMIALWSFLKSPLLLGGDLRSLSRDLIQQLNSPFLKALHQSTEPVITHVCSEFALLASSRLGAEAIWLGVNLADTERDCFDLFKTQVVSVAPATRLRGRRVQPHGHLFLSSSGAVGTFAEFDDLIGERSPL